MSEYLLTQDDKKFGVPEQKKFPMPDADHVRSAIKFFNYVEPKYEKQLAKAILRRAKEFGVDISEMNIGDNNRFKKYLPNDELKHHGILGMKWGVRRYQNPDGSYTEAGKKRRQKLLYKDLKKDIKSFSSETNYEKRISNRNILLEKWTNQVKKSISKESLVKLKNKYKNAIDKGIKSAPYEDNLYTYQYKRSYDDTLKWFEKEMPDYLNNISNYNNKDLDGYHDFRKTREGTENYNSEKYANEYFSKNPKAKKIIEDARKAEEDYSLYKHELSKELLGSYAELPIEKLYGSNSNLDYTKSWFALSNLIDTNKLIGDL